VVELNIILTTLGNLMSKKLIPIFAAFFVTAASAQSGSSYAEIGGIYARYDEPGAWFTSAVGNVKLGYNINENLAVEALVGRSLADTNFYVGSTLISARIDSMVSGFLKVKAPLSSSTEVFGRFGFTNGKISANSRFGSGWASGTSASYGGGIQFNTTPTSYWNIDYMSYYSGSGITVNGMGANVGFKF
jgi:hypothetical protein